MDGNRTGFGTEEGEFKRVEARFLKIEWLHWKCGLIVQGIVFRLKCGDQSSSFYAPDEIIWSKGVNNGKRMKSM